jgi:CubicO group peptidase (beta-lactamase class C family)
VPACEHARVIQGYLHPDFADVAVALRATLRHKQGGGAAAAVYHRGEKVVDIWSGTRDDSGAPWERDTVAMSWSTTKGVVATAAHRLVDRGELDVDAPVAEYWPEFKAAGKEDIRVANLLDHSAGMHRVRGVLRDAEMLFQWDRTIDALAAAPPAYPAGTKHGYHALTFGFLVGEVLRRATGLSSVNEIVQREIVDPLGLEGMTIGATGAVRERVATLLTSWPDQAKADRFVARMDRHGWLQPAIDAFMLDGDLPATIASGAVYDAEVPAMNGVFTARSLAHMYSVIAMGGTLDGVRFLSPETIRRAGTVRTRSRDIVIGWPMRWRLGYHMAATSRGIRPNGFGHFGLGGSGAWADPDLQLSVAMTCNRMAGTPFGDQRLLRVGAAAVRGARTR